MSVCLAKKDDLYVSSMETLGKQNKRKERSQETSFNQEDKKIRCSTPDYSLKPTTPRYLGRSSIHHNSINYDHSGSLFDSIPDHDRDRVKNSVASLSWSPIDEDYLRSYPKLVPNIINNNTNKTPIDDRNSLIKINEETDNNKLTEPHSPSHRKVKQNLNNLSKS